jgi:hypothetical protein
MPILRTLADDFQALFPPNGKGKERFRWLILTFQAIIVPTTASRTSNLLRAIETLFGVSIAEWRYYKLPWERLWDLLWRRIPSPSSDERLLLPLDDSINPKTGKHIFACHRTFDHAAKTNQTRKPESATNHLTFCMATTTITWIYAEHLPKSPARRYASQETTCSYCTPSALTLPSANGSLERPLHLRQRQTALCQRHLARPRRAIPDRGLA